MKKRHCILCAEAPILQGFLHNNSLHWKVFHHPSELQITSLVKWNKWSERFVLTSSYSVGQRLRLHPLHRPSHWYIYY